MTLKIFKKQKNKKIVHLSVQKIKKSIQKSKKNCIPLYTKLYETAELLYRDN